MKKISYKISLILIICFLCIFKGSMVSASNGDEGRYLKEKTITDVNKVWTVKFTGNVDVASITDGVYVKDLNNNALVDAKVQKGYFDDTFEISPPKAGYVKGHKYEITISKNVKSKKNVNLKKDVLMNFYVKGDGVYSANVNVNVAEPPFTMFKKVTISSTNLLEAKKFKVDQSESLCDIGTECTLFTSEAKLKVYFYGADGKNILGEALINVDKDNSESVNIVK